jgi:hypothetical protein
MAIENQHRDIGVGSAATAGTIAIYALAVLQKVAKRKQPRGVRVHGRNMMPSEVQGVSHISRKNGSKHVELRNDLHRGVAPGGGFTYAFRNPGQPVNVSCSGD